MSLDTLEDLFAHELEDMYFAENELVDVLADLYDQTRTEAIAKAFREHREETQSHIARLEEVFEMIAEPPETEECEGIRGLITEHEHFVDENPAQAVLDLYNITAGQKSEHYEIAAYEGLIHLAERLGLNEAIELLNQNLKEEAAALDKLERLMQEYDFEELPA